MSQLSEHHTRNLSRDITALPVNVMHECGSPPHHLTGPTDRFSSFSSTSICELAVIPIASFLPYVFKRVLRQTWTPECNRTCGDLITATAHLFWSEPTYTTFTTTYTCADVKHATIFAKRSLKLYTFKHNYSILKLQKKLFTPKTTPSGFPTHQTDKFIEKNSTSAKYSI